MTNLLLGLPSQRPLQILNGIYTAEFLWQKVNYIHQNPVRAEIVARAEDHLYSSARNYAGGKGLLEMGVVRF